MGRHYISLLGISAALCLTILIPFWDKDLTAVIIFYFLLLTYGAISTTKIIKSNLERFLFLMAIITVLIIYRTFFLDIIFSDFYILIFLLINIGTIYLITKHLKTELKKTNIKINIKVIFFSLLCTELLKWSFSFWLIGKVTYSLYKDFPWLSDFVLLITGMQIVLLLAFLISFIIQKKGWQIFGSILFLGVWFYWSTLTILIIFMR